jgi:translation initiation factor IF-2
MAKVMRLSQVARKLNIGKNTIVEFLESKGYDIEDNPNSKINEDQLQLLSREFADSALDKEEASGLQIGSKHSGNVVIDTTKESSNQDDDDEEQILIKNVGIEKPEDKEDQTEDQPSDANKVESAAPKLKGIKVVGKIDLEKEKEEAQIAEKKGSKKEEGEEKPKKEETPKQPEASIEEQPPKEKPKEPKAGEKPQQNKEEPKEVEKPIAEDKTTQKEDKEEPKKPQPKAEEPKEDEKAKPAKEEPTQKKEEATNEDAEESSKVIEAKAETLKGLKVVGKIDLPSQKKKSPKPVASSDDKNQKESKKKKRPRKRIRKEGEGAPRDQQQQQRQGGGGPQRDKKGGRKGGKRGRFQKEELSDKEIQEQIKNTLAKLSGGKSGGGGSRSKYRREKRQTAAESQEEQMMREMEDSKIIKVNEFISANDLASMMDVSVNDVISKCMELGMFVSINQRLDAETITIISDEFGYSVKFADEDDEVEVVEEKDKEEDLKERAPIVTIMGHVDHGKTSLLDFIRHSKVTESEAGGITQHIGAYDVMTESGKPISFLDTPGHEAFTAMRARGAKLTDIVVIVVAADDNVMPQTKEAINHAQVAGVPIIIAINKIDKPNANPDKIKEELANINILVEDWGGKYQCQAISAKTGEGIEDLLEKILLEAELLELKANPDKPAVGTVVEAMLDKGRGYVATLLVQAGVLKIGDIMLAGAHFGRVKAMFDHRGKKLDLAGPSTPVQVLGLDGAPQAGDKINVMESEREAREIATKRAQLLREQSIRTKKHITLDEIGRRLAIGTFKELNIIVKGDVDGSVEALSDSLLKLSTEEVQVSIIHKGVGQISESDVLLASASDAIIVGFQVRPSQSARKLAEQEEIEIRLYSIIYDAINEIKDAMEGMLAPDVEEVITGNAEVRDTFKISKIGTIAGCMVTEGLIKRNNRIRLIREGIVIYTGEIDALKRFKDDVTEVKQGYECGIRIKNFNDIKIGDNIESFEEKEVKRTL